MLFLGSVSLAVAVRAVLLSALSTIAGFGSLTFTDYGALASIGWATNFGVAATTIFTLVTLPAFIHFSKEESYFDIDTPMPTDW